MIVRQFLATLGFLSLVLFLMNLQGILFAEEIPKVACSSLTESPPVIDGVLDDACWETAEVSDDFIPVGGFKIERTTMRFAYDDAHVYVAVECFWDDVGRLLKKVDEIRAKPTFAEGFVDIASFTNDCSIELFLDPGATMRNHYQILFNAAGQICGQFKGNWDPFTSRPACGVKIRENGWTAEAVFPDQGIRKADFQPGAEWGLNLVRNDLVPVSIWKEVGPVFNEPRQFGRLIIGDYQTWRRKVWDDGIVRRFETISADIEARKDVAPYLYPIYQEVGWEIEKMKEEIKTEDLTNRSRFVSTYQSYVELYGLFHRLDALYSTVEHIARIEK